MPPVPLEDLSLFSFFGATLIVESSSLGAIGGDALMSTCTDVLFMRCCDMTDGAEMGVALALLLPPEAAMIVAKLLGCPGREMEMMHHHPVSPRSRHVVGGLGVC